VEGNGHPETGHEGLDGEWKYSATLSRISALHGGGWGGGKRHTPPI